MECDEGAIECIRVHVNLSSRKPAVKFARKLARKPARPPVTLRCSRCTTHRVFRAIIERGDVTECLVVVFETHDNVAQSFHNYIIIHS